MMFDLDYGDIFASNALLNLLESDNAVMLFDEEGKYRKGWLAK